MAMFDYCQFILLNHSCEDYQKDNCDNCNMYKAYMKGLEEGAAGVGDTINVVEVRRGKWKEVLAGMDFEYECTRCKACVNQIYPYCPNCGAKMGEWVEVPSHWMIVGSKDGEYFEVKEQDDED